MRAGTTQEQPGHTQQHKRCSQHHAHNHTQRLRAGRELGWFVASRVRGQRNFSTSGGFAGFSLWDVNATETVDFLSAEYQRAAGPRRVHRGCRLHGSGWDPTSEETHLGGNKSPSIVVGVSRVTSRGGAGMLPELNNKLLFISICLRSRARSKVGQDGERSWASLVWVAWRFHRVQRGNERRSSATWRCSQLLHCSGSLSII